MQCLQALRLLESRFLKPAPVLKLYLDQCESDANSRPLLVLTDVRSVELCATKLPATPERLTTVRALFAHHTPARLLLAGDQAMFMEALKVCLERAWRIQSETRDTRTIDLALVRRARCGVIRTDRPALTNLSTSLTRNARTRRWR